MAGGWQAPVGALLLLALLVTNVTAAGRNPSPPASSSLLTSRLTAGLPPSTTPTPSTSTSAPPPASLLATPPPPLPFAPAISATSSRPSSAIISASEDLESSALPHSSRAPPAVPTHLLGCDPMKMANALFTHCRGAPGPEAILNERCCVTVVSTVARPSCFCLVQKESAFVMSAVHNRSTMGNLLQKCGVHPDLIRIVDDPCGDTAHTVDDHGCAVSMKASASCWSWKITAIVGLLLVCVLVAIVLYIWLRRPVLEVDEEHADELALRGGCRCIRTKCTSKRCGCNKRETGCTGACQCRGCENPYGIRRAAALEMGHREG